MPSTLAGPHDLFHNQPASGDHRRRQQRPPGRVAAARCESRSIGEVNQTSYCPCRFSLFDTTGHRPATDTPSAWRAAPAPKKTRSTRRTIYCILNVNIRQHGTGVDCRRLCGSATAVNEIDLARFRYLPREPLISNKDQDRALPLPVRSDPLGRNQSKEILGSPAGQDFPLAATAIQFERRSRWGTA
jgi:hypothetical protein